jgi:HAD superfamily hydrolase (TIGR01509 family)
MLSLPQHVTTCLFDLDGVLTDTASVHNKAWKQMFDAYLRERSERTGEPFVAFDPVDAETIYGLGNRKNQLLLATIDRDGVEVYEGSRHFLQAAADAGLRRVVVSSSANTAAVLNVTGLAKYVEGRIDGVTIETQHLKGKPAPDTFIAGARCVDAEPAEAAVFEDALAGVEAGRAGNFGYVIGVNRLDDRHAERLLDHGADIVVADLADLVAVDSSVDPKRRRR